MALIRSFIAIELGPEVKAALGELVVKLEQAKPASLRLARPEGIHLTLKFLGDVPEAQIAAIAVVASHVAKAHRPFTLQLGDAGAFPSQDAPRVLWVGLRGELARLAALQAQLESALADLGFPRESRPFSPHLTIARVKDGTPGPERRRVGQLFLRAGFKGGTYITVDRVSLMRSILLRQGAVYDCLASSPLGGGSRKQEGL